MRLNIISKTKQLVLKKKKKKSSLERVFFFFAPDWDVCLYMKPHWWNCIEAEKSFPALKTRVQREIKRNTGEGDCGVVAWNTNTHTSHTHS